MNFKFLHLQRNIQMISFREFLLHRAYVACIHILKLFTFWGGRKRNNDWRKTCFSQGTCNTEKLNTQKETHCKSHATLPRIMDLLQRSHSNKMDPRFLSFQPQFINSNLMKVASSKLQANQWQDKNRTETMKRDTFCSAQLPPLYSTKPLHWRHTGDSHVLSLFFTCLRWAHPHFYT